MKEKRISFCQGKGSLTHNNRDFIAENVDRSRIKDNITFISQPVGEAYEQLFGESTERYNARQKRNDRKIHGTYYESLFHQKPSSSVVTAADKRKSFYEDIVQVGKMEDSGIGTEDAKLVADCLKEFMVGFQQRNPNFYVFNAVLHMDEATPHLHIDYIPVGHYKRGQDTQNGIAQALKEMGFGEGKGAIARWRTSEIEVLNKICLEHGIQPLPPEKSRGTMTVDEYKEQIKKSEELATENAKIEAEIEQKKQERNEILNYLPDLEKTSRLEFAFDDLCKELDELIKNPISAMKYRKQIAEIASEMKKRIMAAHKAMYKSESTVYEVREENRKFSKENADIRERNRQLSSRNRELYKENDSLKSYTSELEELVSLLERFEPVTYKNVKALQEQIVSQREQQIQSKPAKRKSQELE